MKRSLQDFIVAPRKPQDIVLNGECLQIQWEGWISWNDLVEKNKARPYILKKPGVYEVKYAFADDLQGERLIIGMSNSNLQARIGKMVSEGGAHEEGKRLRNAENQDTLKTILVSWFVTSKAKEVEVCLFRRYLLSCNWNIPVYCNEIPYIRGLLCW